jgi:hypothetical protein
LVVVAVVLVLLLLLLLLLVVVVVVWGLDLAARAGRGHKPTAGRWKQARARAGGSPRR